MPLLIKSTIFFEFLSVTIPSSTAFLRTASACLRYLFAPSYESEINLFVVLNALSSSEFLATYPTRFSDFAWYKSISYWSLSTLTSIQSNNFSSHSLNLSIGFFFSLSFVEVFLSVPVFFCVPVFLPVLLLPPVVLLGVFPRCVFFRFPPPLALEFLENASIPSLAVPFA